MAKSSRPLIAPESAHGPTQIMENGRQFYVDDDVISALVVFGVVEYSPEDGPNARVYRPIKGWNLSRIKREIFGVGEKARAFHPAKQRSQRALPKGRNTPATA